MNKYYQVIYRIYGEVIEGNNSKILTEREMQSIKAFNEEEAHQIASLRTEGIERKFSYYLNNPRVELDALFLASEF